MSHFWILRLKIKRENSTMRHFFGFKVDFGREHFFWIFSNETFKIGFSNTMIIPVNLPLLGWKVMQFLPRRSQKSHCKLRLSMHSSQIYAPVKYSKNSEFASIFAFFAILYPDILGWLSNKSCHGIDNVDHFVSYKNSLLAIFDSVFSFFSFSHCKKF